QQMVLLAHASAEKFCKRNNQGKNRARRVVVLGLNAASGSHGPENSSSLPLPSESCASFVFYCPTIAQLFRVICLK
ncbi:unnamed protein product, partial [Bubo scandiacus]